MEWRAARAHSLAQMGELSRERAALEAAGLALGTNETLEPLRDPRRRPPQAREPIPIHLTDHVPDALFGLRRYIGEECSVSPQGSSARASRDDRWSINARDLHAVFLVPEQLAQGMAPRSSRAVHFVRARLTAFRKPRRSEGHRGWRHSSKIGCHAQSPQQFSDVVKNVTSPFQHALSTRAGCECIAHALQAFVRARPDRHHLQCKLESRVFFCFANLAFLTLISAVVKSCIPPGRLP